MPTDILIIDDDPFIGPLLQAAGRKQGWHVHLAKSGPEGLALLAERPTDLVLLDLGLPEMSGLEVLRRIELSRSAPPVLIMSGDNSDCEQMLRLGAAGTLDKPFAMEEFYGAVQRVLQLEPASPPVPVA